MKVFSSAGVAAALIVSSAAFAAGTAPTQPSPAMNHHAVPHPTMAFDHGAATKALNMLEAQGYGAFSNFRPVGGNFAATVSQNGKTFQVTVDPATGQITRG